MIKRHLNLVENAEGAAGGPEKRDAKEAFVDFYGCSTKKKQRRTAKEAFVDFYERKC